MSNFGAKVIVKSVEALIGQKEISLVNKIAVAVCAGDRCGESVVWSEPESAIYWTDINRFLIHRLNLVNRTFHEWHFDQPVVAISLTNRPDLFLVALASRLILWSPRKDIRVDHGFKLDSWPAVRLNDGRSDPMGNFWIGSMANNVNADGSLAPISGAHGRLYKVDTTGAVSVWRDAVGISNTLCWSPDRQYFYFGDSQANVIYRYDFNRESATISNEKAFFSSFKRGCPDGSAIDSEGFLWNCRFGGGCIVRVTPNGEVDRVIEMPVLNPTTCTFGGNSLRKLFVTSASILSEPGDRLAGSLFEIDVEVKGLPECHFKLTEHRPDLAP